MFVGSEVLLEVRFDVARDRLVGLIRDGDLTTASRDAYGEGLTGLVRVGPGPGVSRLVAVKFQEPVDHGDSMVVALRWEAIGPGGGLFPALDADLTLAYEGEAATTLKISASYRPPLGALGAQLDRVVLHRVAAATVQGFLSRVGTVITQPAQEPSVTSGDGHQAR